jgi:photosystem II stability/assembly factor-like uncharacterized protein
VPLYPISTNNPIQKKGPSFLQPLCLQIAHQIANVADLFRKSVYSRRRLTLALLCLSIYSGAFASEAIFMSVLSSRKHRWGLSKNPIMGLFISCDQGKNWKATGWQEAVRIFYTEQGPDSVIWCAAGNGVLRSRDQGQTWKVTTDWHVTEVMKVKVQPDHPATVYAATAYGVFKTTDGGDHWQKIASGFTADILIDQHNPKTILAAKEEGVFISHNKGKSWQFCGLADKGVRVLAQPFLTEHTYWAGTENDGVFVSTDQGDSWQTRNQGLNHRTVYAIAFHPQNEQIIYVGTHEGGVYRSLDGGAAWRQSTTGMGNSVVHCLTVLPSCPDALFAGTIGAGLYQSMDAGQTWTFNSQEEAHVWGLSVH